MPTSAPTDQTDMSPAAVMERAAAARGDMFPEWQVVADALPETVAMITRTGGYLHKYEGQGGEGQELSKRLVTDLASGFTGLSLDISYHTAQNSF